MERCVDLPTAEHLISITCSIPRVILAIIGFATVFLLQSDVMLVATQAWSFEARYQPMLMNPLL
jgi:hypothetical protein